MTDQARRSPVRIGDIVGGKYRVERVVGAGGMGVVVAAVHLELGQRVALKFILPDVMAGRDAVERFFREARAIARLHSEHITRVFDVSRSDEENPYMVLELLEGEDLSSLNRSKGPLSVGDAVEYLLQACAGLVDAHGAGIIHRDLKPQNLFVTRRQNGAPLVKLLDFGIAKAVGAAAVGQVTLTDSKAVIGSPLYMPPEQMRSARIADVRSDIWSMGVMLYEILGGKLPFDGETVTEICVRVVNETPTPLRTLRPSLDPKLAEIVMRCLEKNPDRRWPNVAQLGAALEPFAKSSLLGAPVRPWKSLEMTGVASDVGGALSSSPASTQPLAQSPASVPPLRMAQTDITWDDHSRDASKPSFVKGIAVGVTVSLVAIGVAVAVVAPRLKASSPPPPAAGSAPPPIVMETPPSAAEPPAAPVPTVSAEAVKPPSPSTPKKRRPATSAPAAAPAPAEPPSVEPAKTTEASPNGAPILR